MKFPPAARSFIAYLGGGVPGKISPISDHVVKLAPGAFRPAIDLVERKVT